MAGYLLLDDAKEQITGRLAEFAKGLTTISPPKASPMQPLQDIQPGLQAIQKNLTGFAQDLITGGLQQGRQAAQALTQPPTPPVPSLPSVGPPAQPAGPPGSYNPTEVESYIRQAAARRGMDPETAVRVARSEGLNTYIGDQGSSFGPFQLHYGGVAQGGNAVSGLGDTFTKQTGLDARDPGTWRQQVDFALDTARTGGWGPWHGAAATGIGERQGLTSSGAPMVEPGITPGGGLPSVSQFGDKQLSTSEAYAACGPAAAVRFAQMFGRNPTLREAVDLARTVGWTEGQGMAGLASESKLFDAMGIAHRVVGSDWQALAREAMSGNPVTISTPGHYFTADSYNPQTGAFRVGSSGTDLRGGAEWMTPEQMEARMGRLQGGLVADHPGIPQPSPLSAAASTVAEGAGRLASKVFGPAVEDLQAIGRNVQGGLQVLDQALQAAHQVKDTDVLGAGQKFVKGATTALEEQRAQPSALEQAQEIIRRAAVQAIGGDIGGFAGETLGGALGLAARGASEGLSGPAATFDPGGVLSRGLEEAGVPQPYSQIAGFGANLLMPTPGLKGARPTPGVGRNLGEDLGRIGRPLGQFLNRFGVDQSGGLELGGGTTGISQTPDFLRESLRRMYPGAINRAAVKEAVQNSVDASRGIPNATTRVNVDNSARTISIIDQGTGMTPETMEAVFMRLGGTKKAGGSSGGMGTAIKAVMANGEQTWVRSVARDPDTGQLTDLLLHGSSDDFLGGTMQRYFARYGEMPDEQLRGAPPEIVDWERYHPMPSVTEADSARVDQVMMNADRQLVNDARISIQHGISEREWIDSINLTRKWDPFYTDVQELQDIYRRIRGTDGAGDVSLTSTGSPTGTTLWTKPLSDARWDDYGTLEWMNRFNNVNRIRDQRVRFTVDGEEIQPGRNYYQYSGMPPKSNEVDPGDVPTDLITTLRTPGAEIDLYGSKATGETGYPTVHLLNNGQYQADLGLSLERNAKLPHVLTADVRATVDPKSPGYPWTADRNALIDVDANALKAFVKNELAQIAIQNENQRVMDTLAKAPQIRGSGGMRLVDDAGVGTDPSAQEAISRITFDAGYARLARTLNDLHNMVSGELLGREIMGERIGESQMVGLGISQRWLGLNMPSGFMPQQLTGTNLDAFGGTNARGILVEPWQIWREVQSNWGGMTPDAQMSKFVDGLVGTMLHEVSHNTPSGGHEETFAGILTRVPQHIGSAMQAAMTKQVKGQLAKVWDTLVDDLTRDARTFKYAAGESTLGKYGTELGGGAGRPGDLVLPEAGGGQGGPLGGGPSDRGGGPPGGGGPAAARPEFAAALGVGGFGAGAFALRDQLGGFLAPAMDRAGATFEDLREGWPKEQKTLLGPLLESDLRKELLPTMRDPQHWSNVQRRLSEKYGAFEWMANQDVMSEEDRKAAAGALMSVGGMTGNVGKIGKIAGVERPFNYDKGTPEFNLDLRLRESARTSADRLSHVDLNTLPPDIMPFSTTAATGQQRVMKVNKGGLPTTDELRELAETSLRHRDFYADQGDEAADLVTRANVDEWLAINSMTSSQTPFANQLAEAITTMGTVRQVAINAAKKKKDVRKAVLDAIADKEQLPLMSYTHPQKRGFMAQGYDTGVSEVKGAPKTSSFAGNYDSALKRDFDPRITNDTWDWQIMNVSPELHPGVGKDKIAALQAEAATKRAKAIKAAEALPTTAEGATPAQLRKLVEKRQKAIERAQAITASIPMQRKWFNIAANDDTAYRAVEGVFNELAAERGMDGHAMQSLMWSAFRHLSSDPKARKLWETGDKMAAIRQAESSGAFAQKLDGEIAEGMGHPVVQEALAKWGDLIKTPPPLKGLGMQRVYHGESPTLRKGVPKRPSTLAFREEQATIRGAGAPTAGPFSRDVMDNLGLNEEGVFPWLTTSHRVHEVQPGQWAVHLPSGNSDTARWIAATVGERAGMESVPIHVPDVSQSAAIGLKAIADPEQVAGAVSALRAAGYSAIPTRTGRGLQVALPQVNDETSLRHIISVLDGAGVPPSAVDRYTGVLTDVRSEEFRRIAEELGGRFEPTTAGRRGLFERGLGGPGGFTAPGGREPGSAATDFAARLGAGAAGGLGGYYSDPNVPQEERLKRAGIGAVAAAFPGYGLAKAAATRPSVDQAVLRGIRDAGVVKTPQPTAASTAIGRTMDVTKQGMLLDPLGRTKDIVSNLIELVRQPVVLTAGGRAGEAGAGILAASRAVPQAAKAMADVLIKGEQAASLGAGPLRIGKDAPVFRILGAMDAFTRTLGEYQGLASKATAMLDQAGIKPGSPAAAAHLKANEAELWKEGARTGARTIFGTTDTPANMSAVDDAFRAIGDWKRNMMTSPNRGKQLIGAFVDTQLPFTGTPSRVWQTGLKRLPVVNQVSNLADAFAAMKRGDSYAAQRALGDATLETAIQMTIWQAITDGNITGPDDPEHPSSIRLGGRWYDYRGWTGWATPMAIMAGAYEGWERGEPNRDAMTRLGDAINSAGRGAWKSLPGAMFLDTLSNVGEGAGGLTDVGASIASSAVQRMLSPTILSRIESMRDPYQREVGRGPEQIWERTQARTPFLAERLPAKVDPMTGEPKERVSSGLGALLGLDTRQANEITQDMYRIKQDYPEVRVATDYPDTVSYRGMTVRLKPDEQRAVAKVLGENRNEILGRLRQGAGWQQMTDAQKAVAYIRVMDRIDEIRIKAFVDFVGPEQARARLLASRDVAGRLVERPAPLDFMDLTDTRREQRRQAAAAGG